MKKVIPAIALALLAAPALSDLMPGHRLPSGAPQTVRERQIDISRLQADLTIDMKRQTVRGAVIISFAPLQTNQASVALDSADIDIKAVDLIAGNARTGLKYKIEDRVLSVSLPAGADPETETTIRVTYEARPNTGLYFFEETKTHAAEAWNYGEGGRHNNWLPLYNGTNDRFSVDFRITVDEPYVVLGNGILRNVQSNRDGSRTYHWVQEEPIPNYLLALNVGHFVEVPLAAAAVGGRTVPLSVWTHEGDQESAAFSFGKTPAMVEFFSGLLGYDYAWPKYDQVTLRNFSGAMETTTMVGFDEVTLNHEGGMLDDAPALHAPRANWNRDDTISHELAHHWFGDLVTCRSLGSLWLNESFATYLHTVWNGHANGEDDLTYQRWRYLQSYLDFVKRTGTVRPLEYFHYDASDDMYTSEITYLKGSLVLHLLRNVLGEKTFYSSLSSYLTTHAFSEVDSFDFQRSLEKVSGRNLDWFFDDWIRGGGGYPALNVSHIWVPERKQVDLTIAQVQALQPFENYFDVPIEVQIVTASGSTTHHVRLVEDSTNVALAADSEPLMVVVDKGNWLVGEVHQDLSSAQLVYQANHGDLAAGLRAVHQLAADYSRDPAAIAALANVLHDTQAHWGLRQEAALGLGTMGGVDATAALVQAYEDADTRIRRATVIGLGRAGGEISAATLEAAIATDVAEEIVGAAAIALGKMRAPSARKVLVDQVDRQSRYSDVIRHSALIGLAELEDQSLAPVFKRFVDGSFLHGIREVAIEAWVRSAPQNSDLPKKLRELAYDPDSEIRSLALTSLGSLHHAEDIEFLREYAKSAVDPNLQNDANSAVETIVGFVTEQ